MRGTIEERLAAKIIPEPNSGCHLWLGAVGGNGYGQIHYEGKLRQAHSVVYRLRVGEIPNGLEPDHLCRVRPCVNENHMELVTHRENIRRKIRGAKIYVFIKAQSIVSGLNARCRMGHLYDEANTLVRTTKSRIVRICRVCKRSYERDRRKRMEVGS